MGLRVVFTIIVEEEVNHLGVLARFTEAVIFTIFVGDVDELLVRLEFKIAIKITSGENNMRIRINIFTREFNIILEFFIERLRTFKVFHVEKKQSLIMINRMNIIKIK